LKPHPATGQAAGRRGFGRRLAWFAVIWLASVAALAFVAFAIRLALA
jgi:hypothetical protein